MASGPGERGHGGHADRVAEDRRCGAGAAAAAVEDDVVDAEVERGVEVLLDVLGRHLHPDRDAARPRPDAVDERRGRPAASSSRRTGRARPPAFPRAARAPRRSGPTTFGPGQVPAGAGLGALAELEVQRLHLVEDAPRPSRTGPRPARRGSGSTRPAPRAASRPRPSRSPVPAPSAPRPRAVLASCRERPEAHVGHEHRDLEAQRPRGGRADHHRGVDGLVVEQREAVQLRGEHLQVVPRRQLGRAARPSPPPSPCGPDRPCLASAWISATNGSSGVSWCGSSKQPVVGGASPRRSGRIDRNSTSSSLSSSTSPSHDVAVNLWIRSRRVVRRDPVSSR